MGYELAKSFHAAGLRVIASARDTSKMPGLSELGIQVMSLDTTSSDSIAAVVKQFKHLDILINNAGSTFVMPVSDTSIAEAKAIFDVNVWGNIALIQAFLPLLLESKGIIVNHCSTAATMHAPFKATYSASKAAMTAYSNVLRMELEPFGVKVVQMQTGAVKTNMTNRDRKRVIELPKESIYAIASEEFQDAANGRDMPDRGSSATQWAKEVVGDILRSSPRMVLWRGDSAWLVRLLGFAPYGWTDGLLKKVSSFSKVAARLAANSSG